MNGQKRERLILAVVAFFIFLALCLGWLFLSRTGFLILMGVMFVVGWLLQIVGSKRNAA
jgi:lipopolysaccharide export LptBFGC system permease protein LptF